jgi:hypothetical protein
VSQIRILLVGVASMLNEILRAAISSETDMKIVDPDVRGMIDLGPYTRRRRIDVVVFPAGDGDFDEDRIAELLHANPRLSLLAIDGQTDAGTLHHFIPAHEAIGQLAQSNLAAAIRAGAALRRP